MMITANQIVHGAPLTVVANFLKFSTAGQFQPLTEEQVDILEYGLEDAYHPANDFPGQRSRDVVEKIIMKKRQYLSEQKLLDLENESRI